MTGSMSIFSLLVNVILDNDTFSDETIQGKFNKYINSNKGLKMHIAFYKNMFGCL